jgi:hypothetical protein
MTDSRDEMTSYYTIFGVGWTILFASLFSSIAVIYSIFKKFQVDGNVAMSQRFPLYIAITDIGLSLSLLGNQFHSLLYRRTLTGVLCKALSVSIAFTGLTNMSVVTSIAIITYLRICKSKEVDTGSYDWKLHAIVLPNSIFWSCLGIPSFGPSRYWCYQEMNSTNKIAGSLVLLNNFGLFGVTAVCFTNVLRKMHRFRRGLTSIKRPPIRSTHSTDEVGAVASEVPASRHDLRATAKLGNHQAMSVSMGFAGMAAQQATLAEKYENVEHRATRKILLHIITFFIQWSSTVPYCLGSILDYHEDWTYIVCTIGMNMGGVMNLIAYIVNQKHK